jgi:hypothetical protein
MRSIARTPQLPLQSLKAPTGHSFSLTWPLQPRAGQTTKIPIYIKKKKRSLDLSLVAVLVDKDLALWLIGRQKSLSIALLHVLYSS